MSQSSTVHAVTYCTHSSLEWQGGSGWPAFPLSDGVTARHFRAASATVDVAFSARRQKHLTSVVATFIQCIIFCLREICRPDLTCYDVNFSQDLSTATVKGPAQQP
ncbi:uncharacterized protein SPSK_10037 [Sporothrix schenckii 1099-18]|uniref:Uncharacterized protein n=1 Tax=Sporothrix schenckii 1099-18 TaxID=1397361 RepID=A0A0F2M7M4_SPOSC|nr:uncharacterized protein SPSK_10037 [Sporothrix schenckii 1099-18]KJR85637.1 hypothetical protein SPSK_10037 [Sporothrix schenckii 1099-18]